MCNNFFGGSNCSWIIILILILVCCGNGNGNGCGCVSDRSNDCCC